MFVVQGRCDLALMTFTMLSVAANDVAVVVFLEEKSEARGRKSSRGLDFLHTVAKCSISQVLSVG